MNIENEIKILEINVSDVDAKLVALGFSKKEPQNFRRFIYDIKDSRGDSWVRLRTDGKKTAVTYKSYEKNAIDGMKEIEIVVDDFDTAHTLLLAMGLVEVSYQENRRQRYTLDETEVSIDEWPLIPVYMEIESATSAEVEKYLGLLKQEGQETTSEPTSYVYKKYGIDLDIYSWLSFSDQKLKNPT
jgi:adenylate cyclase class 2